MNVNRVAQFALDGSAGGIAYPLSDGANLTDQTSSPNSGSSYALGELATDYDVTYTSQDRFEHPNQLDETESALAIRKLLYSYFWLLGESNPSPAIGSGLIPGLRDIVDPTRVLSATAGGTLVEFDRAYDLVTDNNGRPNAIMSNSAVRRKYLQELYANGIHPQYVETSWDDPVHGTVRGKILAMHGTPWYVNDLLSDFGSCGRCYFMVLGMQKEAGPGHGVSGVIPGSREGDMFIRRETNSGGGGSASLMHVDYTWPVGVAMGSGGALSILRSIDLSGGTGATCTGWSISPIYDGETIIGWDPVEVPIESTGCCSCCSVPGIVMQDPNFPDLYCEGENCVLHTQGNPELGDTVTAWCCRVET